VGQALRLPSSAWPDLAILDVRMQGLDGLELTRRLRQLSPNPALKILLTSASVLTFDPAAGRAAGCDDFLPKPFRTADLVEKITALLALTWREDPADVCNVLRYKPVGGPSAPTTAADSIPLPSALRDALREMLAHGDLDAFRAALTAARPLHPACEPHFAELEAAAAAFELSRLRHLLNDPA
jgi:CheY-like chemotaxis protein